MEFPQLYFSMIIFLV